MLETPESFSEEIASYMVKHKYSMTELQECNKFLYYVENTFKSLSLYVLNNDTDRKFARVPSKIYDENLIQGLKRVVDYVNDYKEELKNTPCYSIDITVSDLIQKFLNSPNDVEGIISFIKENFPSDLAEKVIVRIRESQRPYVAIPDAIAWLVHRYAEKTDIVQEHVGICYAPNASKYQYILDMSYDEAIKDIQASINNDDEYFTKLCVFYNNLVDWMRPFIDVQDLGIQKATYLPSEKKLYLRLGSSDSHLAEITKDHFTYYDKDLNVLKLLKDNWPATCKKKMTDDDFYVLKCNVTDNVSENATPLDALILLTQAISMDIRLNMERVTGIDGVMPIFPYYTDVMDSIGSFYGYIRIYYNNELYYEERSEEDEEEEYEDYEEYEEDEDGHVYYYDETAQARKAFELLESVSSQNLRSPEEYIKDLLDGVRNDAVALAFGSALMNASPKYFDAVRQRVIEELPEIQKDINKYKAELEEVKREKNTV